MKWHYGIVYYPSNKYYGLHHIYTFEKEGLDRSENPIVTSSTKEGIIKELELMLKDAKHYYVRNEIEFE